MQHSKTCFLEHIMMCEVILLTWIPDYDVPAGTI